MFSTIFGHVQHYVGEYGYFAVAIGVLLEDFGLPAPGETLLVTGAIVASGGRLNIYLLLALAWLGAVVGDNIGYVIGRTGGHRLMIRFGKRFGVTEDRFESVEGFFTRYGSAVIIFARFVVVLRQFNGIVAGTLEMPWWRFLFLNALGAALWVGFWGGAAYWLGKKVFLYTDELGEYEPYILAAIGIVVLAIAAFSFWRHHLGRERRAEKKREERSKLD